MNLKVTPLAIALIAVAASIVVVVNIDTDDPEYYGQCNYEVSSKGCTVVGLVDEDTTVCKIDSKMDKNPVTAIADGAFKDTNLKAIYIPSSVKMIGEDAFAGCNDLLVCYGGVPVTIFNGDFIGIPSDVVIKEGAFGDLSFMSVDMQDSSDNDTVVDSSFSNIPSIVDKVIVSASLNTNTDVVGETCIDIQNRESLDVGLDFATYGLFGNISISFVDASDSELCSTVVNGVSVTAEHYNFAYLNATYPVLLYSLTLCDGEVDSPTFVFLERKAAYDWDNLPANVQPLPFIERSLSTEGVLFHEYREGTANYIRQLYDLDNDSTFSFYCVDNYVELILQYFIATKIPSTQWTATMLTDGTGTASYLNNTFGVTDPDAKYDEMVEEWNLVKEAVSKEGYSEKLIKQYAKNAYSGPYSFLSGYPLILAVEDSNIDWITGRLRAAENLTAINPAFVSKITGAVSQVYTNNLLAALSEDEAEKFKQLYHFNDEVFNVARENDKKIMIILGTSASAEGINTMSVGSPFYNYVKMTMDFYGTDYYYFYKGHPGYPSDQYKFRQDALDLLNAEGYKIFEIDNSIAAEVIMFYNPDAYLSGWQTTTFNSVVDETRLCSIFGTSLENLAQTYKPMVDMFMTPISGDSYSGIALDSGKSYWLIQYNRDPTYSAQYEEYMKHEIAIYDATDEIFVFYKMNDGGVYEEVSM